MSDAVTVFDTVILGAGIAGASLAWQLAGRQRVALLEREDLPGRHATGRSAALFTDSYGPPMVRALTRASRAFYSTPPAGFAEVPLLRPRGALHVAKSGQQALLEHTGDELAADCPGLRRLSPDETLARLPCLVAERVIGALFDPHAMDIDVNALHQGYLRGLRRRGGLLLLAAAPRSAQREAGSWRLTLGDGRVLRAATVVNATGAWADETASLFAAAPLGLVPRRRSAFTFDAPAGVDVSRWPRAGGIDKSWYLKPDAGRLLGSPANADDTVPQDVQPEELDIALGIARIEAATTLRIRRPASTWAGLRTFSADGNLVIGHDRDCPGLFWLAGQAGYGIQTADAAARLAAALLLGEPLPDDLRTEGGDLAALSPQRLR